MKKGKSKLMGPLEEAEKCALGFEFIAASGNITHTARAVHRSIVWTRARLKRYGIRKGKA